MAVAVYLRMRGASICCAAALWRVTGSGGFEQLVCSKCEHVTREAWR